MIEKVFKPADLPDFAWARLGMRITVREKQVKDRVYLKVIILTPWGVKLEGKETDTMSFEISAKLEGNHKTVCHYLVVWAAAALTKLAPQIEKGEVTDIPQFAGAAA